jgi:hypothetical protein
MRHFFHEAYFAEVLQKHSPGSTDCIYHTQRPLCMRDKTQLYDTLLAVYVTQKGRRNSPLITFVLLSLVFIVILSKIKDKYCIKM